MLQLKEVLCCSDKTSHQPRLESLDLNLPSPSGVQSNHNAARILGKQERYSVSCIMYVVKGWCRHSCSALSH